MTRRMRRPPQFTAQSGARAASFKRATCLPRAGPAMLLADGDGGPPPPPGSDTAEDKAAAHERSGTRLGGRAPNSPNPPIEPAAEDVPPAPRAPGPPVLPLLAVLAGALLLLGGGGSYYVEYSSFESITSRDADGQLTTTTRRESGTRTNVPGLRAPMTDESAGNAATTGAVFPPFAPLLPFDFRGTSAD